MTNKNVPLRGIADTIRLVSAPPAAAVKSIMDNARKAGNSKLFNDAKATWKQDCRSK